MFPRDGELGLLQVRPLDTRIPFAVNLGPQPRDEQWFRMRHFCGLAPRSQPVLCVEFKCSSFSGSKRQKYDAE